MFKYLKVGSIIKFDQKFSLIFVQEKFSSTEPMNYLKIDLTNNPPAIVLEKKYYGDNFRLKIICNNVIGWINPSHFSSLNPSHFSSLELCR